MNMRTENYIGKLHSIASSVSLLHIYIFRRFMNTSTENFRCILHSFASSSSPLHIYFFSRVGNLLIRSSLICSDCSFDHLLRLLKSNEWPCVNCSGCSWQMSDHERFAQVANDKWENRSSALSLTKTSNLLKKIWLKSYFWVCFFFKQAIHSFPLFYERCERIAQVSHQKWAMLANRSGRSPKMSNH